MATLQERAASVYTPEYFDALRAKNAWAGKPWVEAGGINEAWGNYRHALYEDGTYSPLLQSIIPVSSDDYMQRVREGTADAGTQFENSVSIPLREFLAQGGTFDGSGGSLGGKSYTQKLERKASGGANTSLAVLAAIAATMGAASPYLGGAGAAAEGGAAAGTTAGGTGVFDAGMGSYLGLGTTADAAAVGSSLGLGDVAAVGAGGAAAGGGGGADAAWGVNPGTTASQYDAGMADYLGLGNSADAGAVSNSLTSGEWSWLDNLLKGDNTYAKILRGEGTIDDYVKVIGKIGPSLLGYAGAGQQADSYGRLGNQFLNLGAPYRKRLADLYANPDSFLQSNEVQKPVQMASDIMARSLSAKTGNPWGSGNAMQQLQSFSADQLFGKLGQEKDRLGQLGGISTLTSYSPQFLSNGIRSEGQQYDAIGAGVANVFDPPKTFAEQWAEFKRMNP